MFEGDMIVLTIKMGGVNHPHFKSVIVHLENLREINSNKLLSLIFEAFNGNTDSIEHIIIFCIQILLYDTLMS